MEREGNIRGDTLVSQENLLRNVGYQPPPSGQASRRNWHSIDQDSTIGRLDQAHQQIGERALAAAGLASNCDPRSLGNGQGDAVDRRLTAARVGKANCIKFD